MAETTRMNNCIEEMVRLGEDSVLEVKSIRIPGKHVVEPDAKDIADEIAAVANSSGATFFFGVNDKTHEVEGIPLEKLDIAETWVRNLCNDAVKPAVVATIRKVAVCDSEGAERYVIRVDEKRVDMHMPFSLPHGRRSSRRRERAHYGQARRGSACHSHGVWKAVRIAARI